MMRKINPARDRERRVQDLLQHIHRTHAGQLPNLPDSVLKTKIRLFNVGPANKNTVREIRALLNDSPGPVPRSDSPPSG